MSLPNFKTQINNIRKEALKVGFSISTMDDYLSIWNKFISWKGTNNFVYNKNDYIEFLLDYYKFDVRSYTNKSKSHYQRLMRSKRILDDFDTYKNCISKGINIIYIQELLGHVSIITTQEYAKVITKRKFKAIEKATPSLNNKMLKDWNDDQDLLNQLLSL